MTTTQKLIKNLGLALAVFLSVCIIGGIITALGGIAYIFSDREEPAGEMKVYSIEREISSLSVDLSGAELKIKTADKFSVESNHKYISVNSDNGKLTVSETKKPFSFSSKGVTVILSVPEGFVFKEAAIATGAGKVSVDALSCNDLKLSLGAGKADVKNLIANSDARIDGGAGELNIDGGLLSNLELDMGVGELNLKSRIEGESELDYGVGETNLTLLGSREDYKIKLDKGIGEAKIEGVSMADDSVYGTGENLIDIDGGVGEINIEFSEYGNE